MGIKHCPKCGCDLPTSEFSKHQNRKDGLQSLCKQCFKNYRVGKEVELSARNRAYREFNNKQVNQMQRDWRIRNKEKVRDNGKIYQNTTMGRASTLLSGARCRGKKYKRECTITRKQIETRLEIGICEATGIAFESTGPFAPSLDRTDSSGGYTPLNVRVVVRIYNLAKRDWKHADVVRMAAALMDTDDSILPSLKK